MMRREHQMIDFKVFVCLCSFLIKETDQCLETGNGNALPSFQNYMDNGVARITLHHQAIITSYEFQCCGNITDWRVDVQPGNGLEERRYSLDLQVWRPSPTVDGSTGAGEYMLVGNNRFTSITLTNDVAQVTPLPRDQAQFRPGDVLGFYVEEARENANGVNAVTFATFTSETVWYASVTTLNTMACPATPVSAGSNGVLNTLLQGAPVITISTVTYNCPQITSTPPPCPTATSSVNPIDTTTTPQPTMPPTVPTDPVSMATTTTEPVMEEPTTTAMEPVTSEISTTVTDPVTEEPTTSELVMDNFELISFAPTPTETSTHVKTPTPTSSLISNNNINFAMLDTSSIILPVIIGCGTFLIVCMITIIILVLIIALGLKARRFKESSVPRTAINSSYEASKASTLTYDYPNPRILRNLQTLSSKTADMDSNYDIVMERNDAYSNCITERGCTTRDDIVTERNEAYRDTGIYSTLSL